MPHKNLEVWKQSIDFVTEIYKITTLFPKEELYGLTQQMHRSAVSIPSNITETERINSQLNHIKRLLFGLIKSYKNR